MAALKESLDRIDALKSQLDALRPLDREVEDRVLQKFRLWWTYHSNAIEGNKLTQGETEMFLMEGLTAKGKPLKDHLDLRGHSNAINFLLDLVRRRETLTEAALRELHKVLLVESYQVPAITPDGQETTKTVALGEYKTAPNHVRTPTGETHYYATPLETPAKMQVLVDWQRQALAEQTMHPVEVASRFHYEFTAIHPFDDGNGRMARLLMNLILMQAGYPPVVIRNSERDNYLLTLRQADGNDIAPIISFIAEHVESSLDLYLKAANGEEIHEPTDLEKEIALLKMELGTKEEPTLVEPEIQKRLFKQSLDPLFAEIQRHILLILDLFSGCDVSIVGHYTTNTGSRFFEEFFDDLRQLEGFPRMVEWWKEGSVVLDCSLSFLLERFKDDDGENFSLYRELKFDFGPRNYSVKLENQVFRQPLERQLGNDEIGRISEAFVRGILEDIRKRKTS